MTGTYTFINYDFLSYDFSKPEARKIVSIDHYAFEYNAEEPDKIRLVKNGIEKIVKVIPDSEYVYLLHKRSIRAKDGAKGLFEMLKQWTDPREHYFGEVHARKIMNFYCEDIEKKGEK